MSLNESTPNADSSAICSSNLSALKSRLERYKLKDQLITQKEIEHENMLAEKERLEKEREALRLEAEKQTLLLELQRVSSAKPPAPKPAPAQQPAPAPSFFNAGAMSFGYPGAVTEKEAIDWLRNGF